MSTVEFVEDERTTEQHTIPTTEEIEAQIRVTPSMRAGHRRGHAFLECHYVEDGYAYRPFGTEAPWQWVRTGDFDREYIVFAIYNSSATIEMMNFFIAEINRLKTQLRLSQDAMGKRSRTRLRSLEQRS